MSNPYLASTIMVPAIRDAAMLPLGDEQSTTPRLLGFLNREQRIYLTSVLADAREEYQTSVLDIPLVGGQTSYRIPTRSIAATCKLVELVYSGSDPVPLTPMPIARRYYSKTQGMGGDYYFQNKSIVLANQPSSGTLRITYFRRMNKLVDATEAVEVTAFNAVAKTVTIDASAVPSLFTGSITVDIIQGTPHFDTLASDEVATVASNVLTFTDALPSEILVGDWIALAGQTPICQAPLELHDLLVQSTTAKFLEGIKDIAGNQLALKALDKMEGDIRKMIQPRAKDAPSLIINFNGPGWRRTTSRVRRRFP